MSTTADDRRQEIAVRLFMATPGPWRTDRDEYPNSVVAHHANICALHDGGQTRDRIDGNARFIANAPEDVQWLLETLNDVLAENVMLRAAVGEPIPATGEPQ